MAKADHDHIEDIDAGFTPSDDSPKITWHTRRRMAFICLYAYLVGTFVLVVVGFLPHITTEQLSYLETIYIYFVMGTMSIVLGYFGFTTLPFIGRGK